MRHAARSLAAVLAVVAGPALADVAAAHCESVDAALPAGPTTADFARRMAGMAFVQKTCESTPSAMPIMARGYLIVAECSPGSPVGRFILDYADRLQAASADRLLREIDPALSTAERAAILERAAARPPEHCEEVRAIFGNIPRTEGGVPPARVDGSDRP